MFPDTFVVGAAQPERYAIKNDRRNGLLKRKEQNTLMKYLSLFASCILIIVALHNLLRIIVFIGKEVNFLIIGYLLLLEVAFIFTAVSAIRPLEKKSNYINVSILLMIVSFTFPFVKKIESGTWRFMQYPTDIEFILVPLLIMLLIVKKFKK